MARNGNGRPGHIESDDDVQLSAEQLAELGQFEAPPDFSNGGAPLGWKQIDSEQAAFAVKRPGAIVMGRLIGRFERRQQNKPGNAGFYQVRLSHAAYGVIGSKVKGTQEVVLVPPGQLISVDEIQTLKELRKYAQSDGEYDVWIKYVGKERTGTGNTFWRATKVVRCVTPPSTPIDDDEDEAPVTGGGSGGGSEEAIQ
jgi:hypothetical protein